MVALGAQRLGFDAAATADEDLRVGDDVFVRLAPSSSKDPHVVRLWPCLARVRVAPELLDAATPELHAPVAVEAERVLANVPPCQVELLDEGGRLLVIAVDIDATRARSLAASTPQ